MEETKLDAETQQEIDLINIKTKGYSDNLIIADNSGLGYTLIKFIDESELPF